MLPETSNNIKSYDGETTWVYFSIEDKLLKKYKDIWYEVSNRIKKNLIGDSSRIKIFRKPKENFTLTRLQIFTI